MASIYFWAENLFFEVCVKHLYYMACPSQLVSTDCGGTFPKSTDISAILFPADRQDFPQAYLVVGPQVSYMPTAGSSGQWMHY